jgi:hypothetical protein
VRSNLSTFTTTCRSSTNSKAARRCPSAWRELDLDFVLGRPRPARRNGGRARTHRPHRRRPEELFQCRPGDRGTGQPQRFHSPGRQRHRAPATGHCQPAGRAICRSWSACPATSTSCSSTCCKWRPGGRTAAGRHGEDQQPGRCRRDRRRHQR